MPVALTVSGEVPLLGFTERLQLGAVCAKPNAVLSRMETKKMASKIARHGILDDRIDAPDGVSRTNIPEQREERCSGQQLD